MLFTNLIAGLAIAGSAAALPYVVFLLPVACWNFA
jgi:hypothetical protein